MGKAHGHDEEHRHDHLQDAREQRHQLCAASQRSSGSRAGARFL
jgi:hypothetical protein